MSGVVLRCPICGTTQNHPGECDACSEGSVRYFCGNHSPGQWLDAPQCGVCGARFGEAPKSRPEAPDTPSRPLPPPGGPRRSAPPTRGTGGPPSFSDVLADVARELERARHVEEPRLPPPLEAGPRRGFPVVGCLIRLVIAGLFFFALAVLALLLFFGGNF